ncbi:TIM barrel protein [Moorella naiadis]|uniref:sugar phosphate isomerase/epimerase family protein n=1 Tax=Moorella naiadis (nom. illeg.) TaxID=3093670 RepID=UPI003D9CB6E8
MPDKRIKTSVGIWAFGPAITRFVPGGYHPDLSGCPVEERVQKALAGLGPLVDGYEFHYPGEINEENVTRIQDILGPDHDIYTICYGLVPVPHYALGALINPDAGRRREALTSMKRGIELAARVGAKYIYWPGNEGYNYPFQRDYSRMWAWFIEGIQECVEYANTLNVTFILEHKNSEPAMRILLRDIGVAMFVIKKLKELGTDVDNVKINMDWQHLIMNGEPLGEYAALLAGEGLLGHQHANSGWGSFDDDNMVGASFFMETLDLAKELQRSGYGKNGERIGFDLFPYTEDPVEAVKRSILQWEFIYDLAGRIDDQELQQAKNKADAVAAYRAVYTALGLDAVYERQVYARYAGR